MSSRSIQRPFAQPIPRGFTLVEILCVVVILGIASAVIIPQLGTRGDLKAASAARVVMADLMYAQNRAIAKQSTVYVMFDLSAKCIRVQEGSTPTTITHPVTQKTYVTTFGSNGDTGLTDVEIDSASFDGSEYIAFDELGAPYSYVSSTGLTALTTGQIKISSDGYVLTLNIEPYTGEISVVEP